MSETINNITLEFLMNKSQFRKYVEKNDPNKHIENEKHLQKLIKYQHRILNLTEDLMNDADLVVSLDINDCFNKYVRTLILYFEEKEMEKRGDTDTLFDKMDNDEDTILRQPLSLKKVESQETLEDTPLIKSFWGKHVVRKI